MADNQLPKGFDLSRYLELRPAREQEIVRRATAFVMPFVETVMDDPRGKYIPRAIREGLAVRTAMAALVTAGVPLDVPQVGAILPVVAEHLMPDIEALRRYWRMGITP